MQSPIEYKQRERVKGGKGRDRIIVRLRCLGLQDKRFVKENGDQHKGESQRRHCGDDQEGGKRGGDVGVVGQKFEVQNIKEAEWELNPHTGLPGNRFRGFDHRPGLELADFRKGVIEERG